MLDYILRLSQELEELVMEGLEVLQQFKSVKGVNDLDKSILLLSLLNQAQA